MTQEFLNVLFVGLAINGIIIVALILLQAGRGIAQRRAASRHAAAVEASGIRRPTGNPVEAARPWFPDAGAGHASSGRAADPADLIQALEASGIRRPTGSHVEAARPWFPDAAAGHASSGRAADHAGLIQALPELASSEAWRTWLAEESARTARYRRPTTIVVVELAGIDRLAERVGAAAASRLLPPVVDTLRRHARAADRLARLGPSRFGVLLVETDEVQAINYIERIRSGCDLWLAAGAVALRLSIGWAEIQADRPGEAGFLEAERRLYAERRAVEPAEPVLTTDGRDGLAPAFQTSGA